MEESEQTGEKLGRKTNAKLIPNAKLITRANLHIRVATLKLEPTYISQSCYSLKQRVNYPTNLTPYSIRLQFIPHPPRGGGSDTD